MIKHHFPTVPDTLINQVYQKMTEKQSEYYSEKFDEATSHTKNLTSIGLNSLKSKDSKSSKHNSKREEDTSVKGKMVDRGQVKEFKQCVYCKKVMTWRKKWANNWDTVKFCSDKCKQASKSLNRRRGLKEYLTPE
jgi:hypothetical protein